MTLQSLCLLLWVLAVTLLASADEPRDPGLSIFNQHVLPLLEKSLEGQPKNKSPKTSDSLIPSQGSPFGSGRSLGHESATNTSGSSLTRSEMRAVLDRLQIRNRNRLAADEHDPRLNGLIQSYELAFRMQDR